MINVRKIRKSPFDLWFLFCFCFFVTGFAPEVRAAEDVIVIGGDHNYPPYEFINDQGEPDGYNTELTLAIAEVMGLDVEIVLASWDEMKKELEEGDLDLLQGISYSEERDEIFDFSPPHSLIHQSLFARKGMPEVNNLSDLAHKTVIVQSGGIMAEQLYNSGIDIDFVYVDTHADALRLLASGQHDYAFVANLPGLYLGKELALSNIEPVGDLFSSQRYGYAVLKGNDELLALFAEGLAILKNTGRQQAIYNKWFAVYKDNQMNWREISQYILGLTIVMALVIGGVVMWNRSLSKQVARRTKKLQMQQQQLVQADKMASLGILVSGVAHEINNPTSLLLLNLPVLKESFEDFEDILEEYYQEHGDFDIAGLSYSRMRGEIPQMLVEMLEGTQHIRRIVNDLRDFARQEPQELSESVDLNEVLAAAIRLTDRTIRSSTHSFSVSYAEKLPIIMGNAQRLQQVVINLIVNACQALTDTGQSIAIWTVYNPDKARLELIVRDQGRGIDPQHIPRLSDPFFTTKRKEGGTGLGLSISSSIIEEHGGELIFKSELGKGTITRVYLPLNKERA